ncbi:VSP [Giardia lamblia P15]|uniref:VSP n=1 Tax=Giardia intestinalis (strain P15) TaxID=658858 RepID=E1F249_GIAIA|nr:VSP [Giardia lamblia P15]
MCAMWLAASGRCFHCLPNRYSSFKLAASILRRAMLYLTALVLIGLASVDSLAPKQCNGAGATKCASVGDNCLDIKNNGVTKEVCTKCEDTHVPIEGACQEKGAQADKCTPQDPPDGTCKACLGSHYLYAGGCYAACPDGTYADAGVCKPCGASCVKCEKKDAGTRCTKCEDTHVPIEGACQEKGAQADKCTPQDPPDGTCKACKGGSYLYKGGCYASCPQGTPNPETNTCDGVPAPDCNIPNCEACSEDKRTCTRCQTRYFLTPEKNACLGACPAGSYATGQACTPCDPSCAECSGAGAPKCTACPAGKMLRYADEGKPTDGTCVEGCVEGPECETCGLTIGGTKYCSKCKGSSVPLNGVCTSNAARAQFCTTAADGACTVCAAGYFIQGGGCYETTRQPGEQICALTDNKGKCQTCANGLGPDGAGTCPSCNPTCKTCSAANTASTCTTCATGYYKTTQEGVCTSCESDSNGVTGVRNCLNCAPPSTGSGSVLCYLMKGGDSTGGSTNRSGLSTGAIAGIAVAAIVVVGGLVGFLCWWFLCRGKA